MLGRPWRPPAHARNRKSRPRYPSPHVNGLNVYNPHFAGEAVAVTGAVAVTRAVVVTGAISVTGAAAQEL
jgi:2-methylaconitate cis-trans-isomerase PrpF